MNALIHKELTQDDIDMYFYYRRKGIHTGFFEQYFIALKKTRTTFEAFSNVNDEYFELFGEYKYSCMHSFRVQLKKYLIKSKK